MANLRQIVDGRALQAYGTSEGVTKSWDTRGRGRHGSTEGEPNTEQKNVFEHEPTKNEQDNPNDVSFNTQFGGKCAGPGCAKAKKLTSVSEVPALSKLEFTLQSDKGGNHILYDKESLKLMLQSALQQLDQADNPDFENSSDNNATTTHFVTFKFNKKTNNRPTFAPMPEESRS